MPEMEVGKSGACGNVRKRKIEKRSMGKLTPAFSTDLGAVYNTDCMNLLGALKDEIVHTVFADPPFNLAKDYGNGKDKDNLDSGDYLKWCYRWIDECVRVLRPGGSMFVYNLPQWAFHLAAHMEQEGMKFRHWIAVSMKGTFPGAGSYIQLIMRCCISRRGTRQRSIMCACPSQLAGTAAKT